MAAEDGGGLGGMCHRPQQHRLTLPDTVALARMTRRAIRSCHAVQTEEQKKQGGKLSAEETSRRKAAADAEVQRNLELEREWV